MRIDWWTLALQTVNVLVLVWLLARFLFRPVMDIIDRRRAAVDKLIADASAVRDRAQAAEAEVLQRRQTLAAEAARIVADAQARAEAERSAVLQRAADERAAQQAQAEAGIARERASMQSSVLDQAAKLAIVIARRLLARVRADVVTTALLDDLRPELDKLSENVRERIGKAGEPIEVVTAAPLDEGAQSRCSALLAASLHGQPSVTFRVDQELIAGVELRAPHLLLRNSWRADLDRIAHELNQADAHAAAAG